MPHGRDMSKANTKKKRIAQLRKALTHLHRAYELTDGCMDDEGMTAATLVRVIGPVEAQLKILEAL